MKNRNHESIEQVNILLLYVSTVQHTIDSFRGLRVIYQFEDNTRV